MLPDAAAVTRDEQATSVFGLRVDIVEGLAQRRARIVLLAANASRDLLLIYCVFVGVDDVFGSFCLLGLVGALTASWWLADVFAGEGAWRCRFWIAVDFDMAILTTGRERG
jgi:hypothetical protein